MQPNVALSPHTRATELVHLRKPYARNVACGITGSVRITERLSEATCPRCQHDGDPVPRTRALTVEAAHAEALAATQSSPNVRATAVMATPDQDTFVRHNHDDGRALPFGRLKPQGECPRCDELHNGAAPREAHPAIRAAKRKRDLEEQSLADLRGHFASDRHRSGGCGIVCTFGDW